MNLKFKAFAMTAGMFVFTSVVAILTVEIITVIPSTWIPYIGIAFLMGFLFYIMYSLNLSQLKADQKLKELTEKD